MTMNEGDQRNSWTPGMVFWNTVGTLGGALVGILALVIALIALLK